ncbi:MAG: phage holin family protein [Nitrospira sp.]|nr:phage holin family protein [Nitrospira sp.]
MTTRQEETHTTRNGIIGLLGGLIGDARTLVRQELQLLRDEVFSEIAKFRQGVVAIGVGIGFLAMGGLFALIMLVHALHEYASLPLWACYGLIGVVLLLIGAALLINAKHSLQTFNLMPRRTLRSMKEDAQWIKEQVSSSKT